MIKRDVYISISKINHFIIYILGFVFGVFLTKKFVYELKEDTKEYDYIMYQFYKAAIYGNHFRFILFVVIGPLLLYIFFRFCFL